MRANHSLLRSFCILMAFSVLLAGCRGNLAVSSTPAAVKTQESIPNTVIQTAGAAETTPASIPESIRFTHIGLDDGLSQSTVLAITQDSLGFMWFATQDGLNRYDGYEFRVFRPDPDDADSLSNTYVTSLAADDAGNVWVGTKQGGLDFYDSKTGKFRHFVHDDSDPNSLSDDHISAVFVDHAGGVWVGTEYGLDFYSPATGKFTHFLLDSTASQENMANAVSDIREDEKGFIWIGSQYSGLFRLDPATGEFTKYQNDANDPASISTNVVSEVEPLKDGRIWAATNKGLNLLDPGTGKFTRFTHSDTNPGSLAFDQVTTILVDSSGNLWAGTDSGIDRYDAVRNTFIHYVNDPGNAESLSTDIVDSLYESNEGIIWVGTFGGGINKYDRRMDSFRNFRHNQSGNTSLSGNIVFKIYIDEDQNAWIATIDGGVDELDPRTGRLISYMHDDQNPGSLISNEAWAVYKDSQGSLWVGTSGGLERLDPGSSQFTHISQDSAEGDQAVSGTVYDIVEDKNGDMWFGSGRGLYRYNREEQTFTHFENDPGNENSISDSGVIKVYLDQSGILWLGFYENGMDRYDPATGKFTHFRNDPDSPDSLSSDTVLSIFSDDTERLWVGTEDGLNLLDKEKGTFTRITDKDGLPNNVVYGILEDRDGKLWVSTNYGISCYDAAERSFINLTREDGLPGNEFDQNAYAQDKEGNLYFGGIDGLTIFDPSTMKRSGIIPPIVLLSVNQSGTPLTEGVTPEWTDGITIKWPYKSFEFEFSSLSYSDPAKNQYAYYLEGFDNEWVNAGNWREGRYTNLPGGTYTLHMKGTNRDGQWNESGRSLKVTVVPAVWETLWFKILAVILVTGLGLTIYRVRTKSIQENNRELERKVAQRTKEIERLFEKTKELAVVEERNRLARELHDSAKQKAFAALAQLGTAGGVLDANPGAAKAHLLEAENLVYEVIEELTFLIQEMYPLALKEKGLVTSLREYVFDWEARTDILVRMDVTGEKRVHLDVEQAFYRAIQEALSNVARHSHATVVEITLTYLEKELDAVIKDNGCGFDLNTRQIGMGLRTIRERIEALDGNVEIASEPDGGTRITLSVPLRTRRSRKGEKHD